MTMAPVAGGAVAAGRPRASRRSPPVHHAGRGRRTHPV